MQEKPITIANLAWRNIQRRPFRSCCLIIIIMLFSATLFGGSVLMKNLSLGISGMANRLGADILVVPYGYEKNLEVALLRGEPSSFYLKADLIDKIKLIKGVEAVSPQLFIASLNAGCCTSKVQLIGFDQESDFVIKPWLQTQLSQPLINNQVVVGSKITVNVGEEIKFFNHPFKVAAKMDSTGMGFDTSVFMTIPTAQLLMKEANLIEGDTEHFTNYVSSIFVKVDPDYQPKDIVNQIMPKYAIDYNIDFVMTKGMLSNISKWLTGFSTIVYSLSAIFWVLAIIVIFVIFSSSLNERKREISLLRILGASRSDLVKMLLRESLIISALGGIAGIVIAGVLIYAFSLLICQSIGLPCMNISITDGLIYALMVFMLTLIIGPLSSIYSALSLTKFDTYQTLREGE